MKKLVLVLAFICTMLLGNAQVVRIQFEQCDRTLEAAISRVVSIDGRQGCHYVAYANPQELAAFEELGIPYEIDTVTSVAPKGTIAAASSIAQMAGWNKYPNYSTYVAMMQNWATNYPNLCKLDTVGYSYNNHLLLCLKISDNPTETEAEPEFFYMSSMHGDEVTGFYFMLRLIDTLLTSYGTVEDLTQIVNNTQLYIMPDANPDGTYKGGDNYIWQPNSTSDYSGRYNGHGIDLNRTYPDPFGSAGAYGSASYQSAYESTEIENKYMIQYMNSHHFVMAGCMHGGAEILNFPWDTYTSSQRSLADAAWWTAMGNRFLNTLRTYTGSASTRNGFPRNMYTGALSSGSTAGQCFGGDWYAISGGWQDYSNFYNHIRAFTIEVSKTKCPYVNDTTTGSGWSSTTTRGAKTYWYYQKQSLINMIKEVQEGVHGFVVDSVTREPLRAFIEVVNHDRDSSQIYSRRGLGDYYRPIADGTYSFRASCPGYITKTYTNVTATYGTPTELIIELVPEGWVPIEYTVEAVSEDNAKGTVDGGGTYLGGQIATLTATANTGYEFERWSDNNTDNPRSFTVTGDVSYTAYFQVATYTVTAEPDDNTHGSVTGSGTYAYGSSATLTATPAEHYQFTQWNDGNTQNPRTVIVNSDTTFTAQFATMSYSITAVPDDNTHGSVTGGGTYAYGSSATLTATADEHYQFVQWSDGNTQNPRTVTVSGNATYTAQFSAINYTITAVPDDNTHGSVTGGGTYAYGSSATLTATADEHYQFAQWSDGNTQNPRTVTVSGNATYTAQFSAINYTITAVPDDNTHGSVTGGGTYAYGSSATLTATAAEHYQFAQWSDGNTQNPRTVAVSGNATYTAQFTAMSYTITAEPDNNTHGSVTGGGTYAYGETATLTATPATGYEFIQWSDGSHDNPYIVTVTGNATYTASFATETYSITVNAQANGTVTGGGNYTYGSTATLTATADEGYHFTQWNDGNTQNPRNVNVTGNATYTAYFEINSYTITITSANNAQGSTTGSGTYTHGQTVTATAIPSAGYMFDHWSNSSSNNPYQFTATENTALVAYFAEIPVNYYTITVLSENNTMGIGEGSGSYEENSVITISAIPNTGYHFTQWSDGNTQNPRTITVTGNETYTAQFAAEQYQVSVVPDNASHGNTSGSGVYNYGQTVTISATPNTGYEFTQWNDGNTQNPRTITVTGNANYTAIFTTLTYTLTVVPDNNTHGSTTGSGTYTYGATATLTATAAEGYTFQHWNDGNTQATRTVTVMGDAIYTAYFVTNSYQIVVNANNPAYGNTSGSGSYSYGEQVTISATASAGHTFSQWDDGNTQNPRTITVTGNATYTAIFTTNAYQLTVVPDEASHGTTTGSGTYEYGTHVSISATAADGYVFRAWNDGNTYPIRTVVVEGNDTYTAYFDAIEYHVEVKPNNTICGTTTGSGTYSYMDEVTATATPAEGFVFDHWSDGSTDNPYVFNVTHNITLIAVFVSDGSGDEGIDDVETVNYTVYPNPTSGIVYIQSNNTQTNGTIKLYNLYGQLLQELPADETSIDMSPYAKGTYILRIGEAATKIVKY